MDAPDAGPNPTTDFVSTWRQVMQDPAGFFATMPEAGGLGEPIRFLVTCAALDAAGTFLVSWNLVHTAATFLGLVAGSFVLGAALTLTTQQLFEGRAGFEPVFRAVAYGSAPAVFFWVPWLAGIPCVYAWYLQMRAVERVQSLDATRAAVATLAAWAGVWLLVRGFSSQPLHWIGTR